MKAQEVASLAQKIADEINSVIVGKEVTVSQAVLTMLCNGHALIEDIPGVGKTTLAKAIAKTIGGEFRRVQFTPDLLPSDITGASIFNQQTSQFEFRAGPVFTNILLVDEINRATPKTQSSLLEAMEERQVTSDGETRRLPEPFFVIATQNNVEMTGTFPLPEAQMDRFFGRISLGYPDRNAEIDILRLQQTDHPLENVKAIASTEELVSAQRAVREVHVDPAVRGYMVDVVRATRENALALSGASPRGALYLMHAAQAMAAMNGLDFVRPDDVKSVAVLVLAHRVVPRGEVSARGVTGSQIITQVLDSVRVPVPMA